ISPGYQGTLGWGTSAAIGAQVACPDVPVVSVIGDGGFMFGVQEMATAVQHNIPFITILANDNSYGNVMRIQDNKYGGRRIGSELRNPDFKKLTDSFGAHYLFAKTPGELQHALKKAININGPVVIEVPVS